MKVQDAVKLVADKFNYSPDTKTLGDSWRVMPLTNNKFIGDCDDFAITCFWYISNKNIFTFLFHLLITHKYAVYRCKTINDEWHIVGRLDNLWFDNWTLKPLTKEQFINQTKHTITMRYIAPTIAWFLLIGLFKK